MTDTNDDRRALGCNAVVMRLWSLDEGCRFAYCPLCGSLIQLIRGGGGETLVEPSRTCHGAPEVLSRDEMIDRLRGSLDA